MKLLLPLALSISMWWLIVGVGVDVAVELRQSPHIPNHQWSWSDRSLVVLGGGFSLWELLYS